MAFIRFSFLRGLQYFSTSFLLVAKDSILTIATVVLTDRK
jgi:hypothetical protein